MKTETERRELTERLVLSPRIVRQRAGGSSTCGGAEPLSGSEQFWLSFLQSGEADQLAHTNPAQSRVGDISLSDAREQARRWLTLIREGRDPKQELQAQRNTSEAQARGACDCG